MGVDHGRAKLGFALSEAGLVVPLRTEKVSSLEDALEKVEKVVEVEKVEKVVVGVSEGKMGQEQERFAQGLAKILDIPIETWDETLSTRDAQTLAHEAGIGMRKRGRIEDAWASAVMLQSYIEAHEETNSKDTRNV